MIHHSLGPNPDHGVYRGMSEAVRVASTFLTDPSTAPEEIDVFPRHTWFLQQRVITVCVLKSKPVYIFLPLDMVAEPVDATRLGIPLNLTPPTDYEVEDELVEKILDALYAAKNPMILVDVLTSRFHCTPQVRQLVDITQLPVSLTYSRLI